MARFPSSIDRFVGGRIRMHRLQGGVSQEDLGEAVGLTFQQIQNYESGTSRITVDRLHQIADVLGLPVTALYEGLPPPEGAGDKAALAHAAGAERLRGWVDASRLIRAFSRIQDEQIRRNVVDLVVTLGSRGT